MRVLHDPSPVHIAGADRGKEPAGVLSVRETSPYVNRVRTYFPPDLHQRLAAKVMDEKVWFVRFLRTL